MRNPCRGTVCIEGLFDNLDFAETDPHGTTVRVEKSLRYETREDADEADERDADRGGSVATSRGW